MFGAIFAQIFRELWRFSVVLPGFCGILPVFSPNQNFFWGCGCIPCTPASYDSASMVPQCFHWLKDTENVRNFTPLVTSSNISKHEIYLSFDHGRLHVLAVVRCPLSLFLRDKARLQTRWAKAGHVSACKVTSQPVLCRDQNTQWDSECQVEDQ